MNGECALQKAYHESLAFVNDEGVAQCDDLGGKLMLTISAR